MQSIFELAITGYKTRALPLDHGVLLPNRMLSYMSIYCLCCIFKFCLSFHFSFDNLTKIEKMSFKKSPSWFFTFVHCLELHLYNWYSLYGQNSRKYKLHQPLSFEQCEQLVWPTKEEQRYTEARKDSPGKQKFDGLCLISLEPLVLQISYIPHWKALISSSLEL